MSRFDPKNSYTPVVASPRAWAEIEEFYLSLTTQNAFDQMPQVDLVRHIRATYAKDRLLACTSMHTLIISVNNPIELGRENLRIDYHLGDNQWEFNYLSKPFKQAEFTRRYATQLGIEKFDKFVTMIGW